MLQDPANVRRCLPRSVVGLRQPHTWLKEIFVTRSSAAAFFAPPTIQSIPPGSVATAAAQPAAMPGASAITAAPTTQALFAALRVLPDQGMGLAIGRSGSRTKESGYLVQDGFAMGVHTLVAMFLTLLRSRPAAGV